MTRVADLSPSDRIHQVVAAARQMSPDSLAEIRHEMGRGDRYTRYLAVSMAAATGNLDHLAVALRDPHPQIRAQALSAKDLPAHAVADLLMDPPLAVRMKIYTWLRQRGGSGNLGGEHHRALADHQPWDRPWPCTARLNCSGCWSAG